MAEISWEEFGVLKSSAQVTDFYTPDELVGRLVVGAVTFSKKQIGPHISECLITGFHSTDAAVALCVADKEVPIGAKLC